MPSTRRISCPNRAPRSICASHEPYAVLLTSDGGGDTLFDRQQQQPAPAVERLCDWLTENDEKTVTEALAHVIKEKMIPATEDDVSVAILYCSEDE